MYYAGSSNLSNKRSSFIYVQQSRERPLTVNINTKLNVRVALNEINPTFKERERSKFK